MAAVKVVTASVVVNFSDAGEGDYVFSLEVDDRPEGLNRGNTTFRPGDNVGLLLFKTQNVNILEIVTTHGDMLSSGSSTKEVEDQWLTYASEPEASVSYPLSSYTFDWYGSTSKQLGGVQLLNEHIFRLSTIPEESRYIGIAKVEGIAPCLQYRLTNTLIENESSYQIGIYAFGEVT